eukprot:492186-Amphidinium_carterae.1
MEASTSSLLGFGTRSCANLVGSSAGLAADLTQPTSNCMFANMQIMAIERTSLLSTREEERPLAKTDCKTKLSTKSGTLLD